MRWTGIVVSALVVLAIGGWFANQIRLDIQKVQAPHFSSVERRNHQEAKSHNPSSASPLERSENTAVPSQGLPPVGELSNIEAPTEEGQNPQFDSQDEDLPPSQRLHPGLDGIIDAKTRRLETIAGLDPKADVNDTRAIPGLPQTQGGIPLPTADALNPVFVDAWRDVMLSPDTVSITEKTIPFGFALENKKLSNGELTLANLSSVDYQVTVYPKNGQAVMINGEPITEKQTLTLSGIAKISGPDGTHINVIPGNAEAPVQDPVQMPADMEPPEAGG